MNIPTRVFVYPAEGDFYFNSHREVMEGLATIPEPVFLVSDPHYADLIICHTFFNIKRHNPCPPEKTIAYISFGLPLDWTPPEHVFIILRLCMKHDLSRAITEANRRMTPVVC